MVGFGIGHTRYSTAGKKSSAVSNIHSSDYSFMISLIYFFFRFLWHPILQLDNTQPVIVQTYHGQIAIGHNGNLTTHNSLRNKLLKKGYINTPNGVVLLLTLPI
jgi:glutamine phosphoribosylpyrophosphate amidotransferase